MNPSRFSRPLDPGRARQIERALVLLPAIVWLLFAWTGFAIDVSPAGRMDRSGHIKGHDFVHFYVLGEIGRDRATEDLYNFAGQAARTDRIVPEYEDRFVPAHAPQVALFFAPLALLPYTSALAVWWLASAAIYAVCCRLVLRQCRTLRAQPWTSAIYCAAFPAFFAVIASGQTSVFSLAWFALAFVGFASGNPWMAGAALGSLAYKPTLGLMFALALLFAREWKTLAAAALAALAQIAAAVWWFGVGALTGFVANAPVVMASASLMEPDARQLHSLRAFFTILIPSPSGALIAYLLAASVVVLVAAKFWRSRASLELRFAAMLVATVLIDPHVFGYELVVLVPALALTADRVLAHDGGSPLFWATWGGCVVLPALGALTTVTHLQLSTVALVALLGWILKNGPKNVPNVESNAVLRPGRRYSA